MHWVCLLHLRFACGRLALDLLAFRGKRLLNCFPLKALQKAAQAGATESPTTVAHLRTSQRTNTHASTSTCNPAHTPKHASAREHACAPSAHQHSLSSRAFQPYRYAGRAFETAAHPHPHRTHIRTCTCANIAPEIVVLYRYAGRAFETAAQAEEGQGKLLIKGIKAIWRQSAPFMQNTLQVGGGSPLSPRAGG